MFELAKALSAKGILGINQRNADYILIYNDRAKYPLVDDKYITKQLALQSGVAVPELYHTIEIQRQIRDLPSILSKYSDFVIKPSRGSGGEGIIVVSGRVKDLYRTINGQLFSFEEIEQHLTRTLSGVYSLGGRPDKVLIEYRVQFDPIFERISYLGVPDIRTVVFMGVPVMCMVRLPTRMSSGKANLHRGAIGVGIDIATGKTLSAVWRNNILLDHPDTGNSVVDVEIPSWVTLLKIASQCQELAGLGYMGVDLVLDKDRGPLLLELNARPGLNIQIANRAGLLPRLKLVEKYHKSLNDSDSRVNFAIENFGS